jgi:hypothetical protein
VTRWAAQGDLHPQPARPNRLRAIRTHQQTQPTWSGPAGSDRKRMEQLGERAGEAKPYAPAEPILLPLAHTYAAHMDESSDPARSREAMK